MYSSALQNWTTVRIPYARLITVHYALYPTVCNALTFLLALFPLRIALAAAPSINLFRIGFAKSDYSAYPLSEAGRALIFFNLDLSKDCSRILQSRYGAAAKAIRSGNNGRRKDNALQTVGYKG